MGDLIDVARHVIRVLAFSETLDATQREALDALRDALANRDRWQDAGVCVVDSGALMLIDPGHAERHLRTGWYDRNVRDVDETAWRPVRPISIDGEGLGVIVHAATERATCPVRVRMVGGRIAELRVEFEEEEVST